jgi:Leucine-rich repeat (LRR) protein
LSLLTIGGDHQPIEGQTFTDADVKAVYIKQSVLSRVPGVIFTKFPNVELLSIPSTQMTIINDDTFESCDNLKRLDVSLNFISEVTKTSLQKCQKLETINLSGNPIEDFDTDLFKLDPQLKHVVLIQKL